jgi:hypothetical protein
MGYAGYAPGHKVVELTVLQQLLKLIKSDKSLETLEKLTRNSAQAPAEEKFRKVRPLGRTIHAKGSRCTFETRLRSHGRVVTPRVRSQDADLRCDARRTNGLVRKSLETWVSFRRPAR